MTHLDEAADLQRRFGGLERLYGLAGAAAVRRAHVAVVGIGGVGSWAAEALARSGVGALTLVDLDHVAESNINRQVHALDSTLGQAKVLAMRERIAQIHPRCTVHAVEEFAEPENWPQLLPPGVDAVIDACDQLKAKTAMAAWARASRRNRSCAPGTSSAPVSTFTAVSLCRIRCSHSSTRPMPPSPSTSSTLYLSVRKNPRCRPASS